MSFPYFIINNVCLLIVKSLFLWSIDEKVHICGYRKFIFHLMDIAKIPKKFAYQMRFMCVNKCVALLYKKENMYRMYIYMKHYMFWFYFIWYTKNRNERKNYSYTPWIHIWISTEMEETLIEKVNLLVIYLLMPFQHSNVIQIKFLLIFPSSLQNCIFSFTNKTNTEIYVSDT